MAIQSSAIKAIKEIEQVTYNTLMKEIDKKAKTAERGAKISQAQAGVPKRAVMVEVDGNTYATLCDGLKAIGYNIDKDWIRVRKNLKLANSYTERDYRDPKVSHTFKLV